MYTEQRIRKCKLCSHVLLGHLRQKHFFSSCWTHVFMSLTSLRNGDEIVCLVLYDYGCTFIFFLLLVWHMGKSQPGEGLGLKPNQFLHPSLVQRKCLLVQRKYEECVEVRRGRQCAFQLTVCDQETTALDSPSVKARYSATSELTTTTEDKTTQHRTWFRACTVCCLSWIHAGATSWRL